MRCCGLKGRIVGNKKRGASPPFVLTSSTSGLATPSFGLLHLATTLDAGLFIKASHL